MSPITQLMNQYSTAWNRYPGTNYSDSLSDSYAKPYDSYPIYPSGQKLYGVAKATTEDTVQNAIQQFAKGLQGSSLSPLEKASLIQAAYDKLMNQRNMDNALRAKEQQTMRFNY